MRRGIVAFVALLSIPLLVCGVFAQVKPRTAVFEFVLIGVEETNARVAVELLRGELSRTDRFYVITGEGVCETPEKASQKGKDLGAEKAVIGSISRLGERYFVKASLVDVKTGEVEFTDQIPSASVEDIEVVMKRLARGLAERKKYEETAEVGTVIEKELEEPRRRKSFVTKGLMVGYLIPSSNSYGDTDGAMLTWDFLGWYETPDFTAELVAGVSTRGGSHDGHIEFGLLRLLSRRDFAPYLGGSLGMHMVASGSDDNNGLGLSVKGGMIAFRTYDFRLVVNGKYTAVFADLSGKTVQHGFTITFGLTHTGKGGGCLGCLGF